MTTTIWPGFQQDWYIAGAPDSTLVLGQGGTIFVGDRILDTLTNNWWFVTVVGTFDIPTQTYTGMVFEKISRIITEGDIALSLGTATVSLPSLTSDQKIRLSCKTPGGIVGAPFLSAKTAGTGFTITSTSLLDASVIHYEIFN